MLAASGLRVPMSVDLSLGRIETAASGASSRNGAAHRALQPSGASEISATGRWEVGLNESDNSIDYDQIYGCCLKARDELVEKANLYRKKMKQPPIDLSVAHSWHEVDDAVQSACGDLEKLTAQDKDFSGPVGKLKQAFRALCRHAGAGQTFTALIPSDSFGFASALCGGLKVIFSALQQSAVYREEIYKALEELPLILSDSADLCNLKQYGVDEELHRRAAALYVAVFKALRQILDWFLKRPLVAGMKLLVDPTRFSEKLKECMAEVKLRSQLFETRGLKLSRQFQQESAQLQQWNTLVQERMAQDLQTIMDRTETIREKLARVEALEKLDFLLQAVMDERQLPSTSGRLLEESSSTATARDILDRFLYDDDMVGKDCRDLLKMLNRSDRRSASYGLDDNRVLAMQSNYRLRAWLTVDEPSLLLLNGRAGPRPNTEVSLVSAKIAARLVDIHATQRAAAPGSDSGKPLIIPLAFFCGQHRDWQRDANGSADELAMSLLLQLVDRGRDALPPEALRRCGDTVPGDVGSICSSLEALVGSLPRRAFVVVVIDGLRFFLQPATRQRQTREVVARLVSLFRRGAPATLKMLLTSPTRSECLEDLFEDDEVLHLGRDVPGDGPGDDLRRKKPIEFRVSDLET